MPQPKEAYTNERLGLTFSYPANWAIDASDPTLIHLTPSFGGFVLVQANMTGPTTLQTQLSQFARELSDIPNYHEISRTRTDGDVPRYLISGEWSVGDTAFRGDFILTVEGARVFSLWAVAMKELFDQNRADFQQVLESLKVTLAPSTKSVDTSAALRERLDDIGERVTRIRGLAAPSALTRRFLTREEFVGLAEGELLDEETRRDMEQLKNLCVVLDLCSRSDDLVQILLGLQTQGVLGYYKGEEKSLTVVTVQEGLDPLAWLTYAHEYTHALQDQEFDLSTLKPEEDTFDSSKAVAALLEGDANLMEYLFYESLPPGQRTLAAESLQQRIEEFSRVPEVGLAPRIMIETFGWEHAAGPNLVFRLYLEGGLEAINLAYQDPPRSTEQVLHPEKYLAREEPHAVDLPDLASALGERWKQLDTGVLGELLIGVYLGTFLSKGQAVAAAEGLGGDRYALFRDDGGRPLIAMRFSWDTVEDADEFFQAYLDFAGWKGQGRWTLVETGENTRLWVGEDISVHLSLEGDRTLVIIGPAQAVVEMVLKGISAENTQVETERPRPSSTAPVSGPVSIALVSTADVVRLGQEFNVEINVDPRGKGVSGLTVRIEYDPNVLQVVAVQPGTLLGQAPTEAGPFIDETTGVLEYATARIGPTKPPTPSDLFATVKFLVLDTAPAGEETSLKITEVAIPDENIQEIREVSIGDEVRVEISP